MRLDSKYPAMREQQSDIATPENTARSCLLVVLETSVGDLVMNQTLLHLLKKHEPTMAIDVVAPQHFRGLIKRIPEVRNHLEFDITKDRFPSRSWFRMLRQIRSEGYPASILIPRSTNAGILLVLGRIACRTGFKQVRPGLINDLRVRRSRSFHEKIIRLLPLDMLHPEFVPNPHLETHAEQTAQTMQKFELSTNQDMIVLAPDASRLSSKKWPLESFIQLAGMLISSGHHVIVLGGGGDLGRKIVQEHGHGVTNLCGRTSLDEAVDIITRVRCVVANDSGLLHVAAAVQTPVVGIYGPTSPEMYPPLTNDKSIFWGRTICSPCYKYKCPYPEQKCMAGTTHQNVYAEIRNLLEKQR